jgi:hypothetical protein
MPKLRPSEGSGRQGKLVERDGNAQA